jgi:hypothetical protein
MPATTVVDGHRPCSRCRAVKPITAEHFHRNRRITSGFSTTCKECYSKYVDAPRISRDRDKRSSRSRAAYAADPGRKLAQNRQWKQKNLARSYDLDARSLRKRLSSDPVFKFSRRISALIRRSMNGRKSGQAWEALVGYTVQDLRAHLDRFLFAVARVHVALRHERRRQTECGPLVLLAAICSKVSSQSCPARRRPVRRSACRG